MNNKSKAPNFLGLVGENKEIALSDFAGKYLVIYFYPKDKTSGCTVESQDFRDLKLDFQKLNCEVPSDLLIGQNIIFKSDDNIVGLSKLLISYQKEYENFEIKGGVLEGNYIDSSQISELAKLPSKEELIAKTVGLIKGPLSGLVATLSNPINSFINVLNNIKKNK